MSPSHRFSFEFACAQCGTSGVIKVMEDAGPPFTDPPRREYRAEPGKFTVEPGSPPTIRCEVCGAKLLGPF
jgi:hypothetical protein